MPGGEVYFYYQVIGKNGDEQAKYRFHFHVVGGHKKGRVEESPAFVSIKTSIWSVLFLCPCRPESHQNWNMHK